MGKLGWHSLGTSFDCPCGMTHHLPIAACHIGTDAAQRLAHYAREQCGKTCLVVSDENTRKAGGEHLISHYLDMKHALYGTPNDLHGIQVGVATVYCLGLWEKALAIDPESLRVDALLDAQLSEADIQQWIEEDWGAVAPEVLGQWREKALDRDALHAELDRFRKGLSGLRELLQRDLLPSATVARAIREAGGPTEPEGMDAPAAEYQKALRFARYLRNRFTILDLAAELCIA